MREGRRLGALAAMVLSLLVASLMAAAPAVAGGVGDFADNQPLVVDLDTAPPSVNVLVVNSAKSGTPAVSFTLRVTGTAARYLRIGTATERVAPGLHTFTLTVLGNALPCTGTLVLSADDGSLARQPVQLVGALPSGPASTPPLVPGSFDSLSVPATSRIPSFFRPMPSALAWGSVFWAVLVATLFFGGMYRAVRTGSRLLATAYGALVMLGAVISLVLLSGWVGSLIDGAHDHVAVSTKAWQVQPAPQGRITTTLAGSTGDIAEASVNHATLRITGLGGAGTYTGTVHTNPTGTGGDIKVTATVRDWWLYAFLAVSGGVLLGYLVSWFYAVGRPAAQLRVKIAELRRRILGQESTWRTDAGAHPWATAYQLDNYATPLLDAANASPDVAAASAQVDALDKLATQFDALRWRARALAVEREQLCTLFEQPLHDPDTRATPAWLVPVLAPLDLANQDPATTDVVTNRAKVVEAAEPISANVRALADRLTNLAQRIVDLPGQRAAERAQLHADWITAATALLRAGDADAVKAVAGTLDTLAAKLLPLERSGGVRGVPEGGGVYAEEHGALEFEPEQRSAELQELAEFARDAPTTIQQLNAAPPAVPPRRRTPTIPSGSP